MYRKLGLTEAARIEQEELDIRCLQLLRAIIHNEERKLPEDWEEHPTEHRKSVFFSCVNITLSNRMVHQFL